MPKARDPNRNKAFEIYKQNEGNIDLVEIASQLNVSSGTVRGWKSKDRWDDKLNGTFQKNTERSKRNKGAQLGNKNAEGHGAPEKNKNAEKHGLFSKYLPEESMDIINSMSDKSPLDLIWDAIQIQYAAIIRSQQIMYVKDRADKTIEKVGESSGDVWSEKWEVQQAWDKQANFLKAQSRAVESLKNMVKDYLELEGKSKSDASESAKDWKAAIVEIAKRRAEKHE